MYSIWFRLEANGDGVPATPAAAALTALGAAVHGGLVQTSPPDFPSGPAPQPLPAPSTFFRDLEERRPEPVAGPSGGRLTTIRNEH